MAGNTIQMQLQLQTNLGQVNQQAQQLNQNLSRAQQTASRMNVGGTAGSRAAASRAAAPASRAQATVDDELNSYGVARGAVGTGAAGRDFAKQSQGLGGLVHVYATFAANIFAVGAAFNALKSAMDFEVMIKGAKLLEASTGAAIRNMADSMKEITEFAISSKEALQLTTLATSAGLTRKQIENLTKGAKGASIALGRDMSDSITRVIRGVTKLEPELIDELGVTVKATEAQREYAKSLGTTVDNLTSYQKMLAYTEAVQKQLNDKFKDAAELKDINPYTKLLATVTDAAIDIANVINKVIAPIAGVLADNFGLVVAGILLLVKSLITRAIPEINKIFTVDPRAVEATKNKLINAEKDIKQAKLSTYSDAKILREKELADIKSKITAQQKLVEVQRAKELSFAQSAVAPIFGKTTQVRANILKAGSFSELQENPAAIKALKTKETTLSQSIAKENEIIAKKTVQLNQERQSNSLNTKGLLLLEEEIHLSQVRALKLQESLSYITRINSALNNQIAEEKELLRLEQERKATSDKPLPDSQPNISKQLAADKANSRLISAELRSRSNVQQAAYLHGSGSTEHLRAQEMGLKRVAAAATMKAIANGQATRTQITLSNGIIRTTQVLNWYGRAMVGATVAGYKFATAASAIGAGVNKALGAIGLIATAATILFELFDWGSKALGLYSKGNEDLNKTHEESAQIAETAYASLAKYNKLNSIANRTIEEEVALQALRANTLDSISSQLGEEAEKVSNYYKSEREGILDSNQLNASRLAVLKLLDAALAKADKNDAPQIVKLKSEVADTTKNWEEYSTAVGMAMDSLDRMAKKSKNTESVLKDISKAGSEFGQAILSASKKESIKDSNLSKANDAIEEFKKGISQVDAGQRNNVYNTFLSKLTPEITAYLGITKELEVVQTRLLRIKELEFNLQARRSVLETLQTQVKLGNLALDAATLKFHTDIVAKLEEELRLEQSKKGSNPEDFAKMLQGIIKVKDTQKEATQQRKDLLQAESALGKARLDQVSKEIDIYERKNKLIPQELLNKAKLLALTLADKKAEEEMLDAREKHKSGGNEKVYKLTEEAIKLQVEATKQTINQEYIQKRIDNILKVQTDYLNKQVEAREILRNLEIQSLNLELKKQQISTAKSISSTLEGNNVISKSSGIEFGKQTDLLNLQIDAKERSLALSKEEEDIRKKYSDKMREEASKAAALGQKQVDSTTANQLKLNFERELQLLKDKGIEQEKINELNKTAIILQAEYQKALVQTEETMRSMEKSGQGFTGEYMGQVAEDFTNKIRAASRAAQSAASVFNEGLIAATDNSIDKFFDMMQKSELTMKGMIDFARTELSNAFRDAASQVMKNAWKDALSGILPETKADKAQNALISALKSLEDAIRGKTPIASAGDIPSRSIEDMSKEYGIDPNSEQARMLAEQEGIVNKQTATTGFFDTAVGSFGKAIDTMFPGMSKVFEFATGSLQRLFGWLVPALSSALSMAGGGAKGILGGITGLFGGGSAGSSGFGLEMIGAQNVAPDILTSMAFVAKGGVFNSPSLSQYSGTVVSSPTMFAFAKGAGLMGEAGPEAILPLKRDASGNLGIRGGGGDVNISITVNAETGETDAKGTASASPNLDQFAKNISGMVKDEIVKQKRPGGLLYA
jgi:hypothetical protein